MFFILSILELYFVKICSSEALEQRYKISSKGTACFCIVPLGCSIIIICLACAPILLMCEDIDRCEILERSHHTVHCGLMVAVLVSNRKFAISEGSSLHMRLSRHGILDKAKLPYRSASLLVLLA